MKSFLARASVSGIMILTIGVNTTRATDVLDAFHARYRSLSSITMRFRGTDGLHGTLAARKGGKYRIDIGSRTIVCDGRTVWNADRASKSVIVNTYKPLSSDVSLERVFFEVISVYRSEIVERSPNSTIIRLTAPSPNAIIANVSALDITLNRALMVTSISVISGPSRITYSISDLQRNLRLPESTFRYTPPKNWEVIDVR